MKNVSNTDNEVIRNFDAERQALEDGLFFKLYDHLTWLEVGIEALTYLSQLDIGNLVAFKTEKIFNKEKSIYLPNLLKGEKINSFKNQNEIAEFLKILCNKPEEEKRGKIFFCTITLDRKKVLWVDCTTKKPSMYLGALDIYTKQYIYFQIFSEYPDSTSIYQN
ncbi:MAG: hypothetical protein WC011_03910 [Candidatus Paceibacterota bacterium]